MIVAPYKNFVCSHTFFMKNISGNLTADVAAIKKILPAEDILTFPFDGTKGMKFTLIFADPITDKQLLGEQVVRPLRHYEGERTAQEMVKKITSPEARTERDFNKLAEEILAGNPVLLWEGADEAVVSGVKKVFVRAVSEPPTDIALKGPREGFIEDIKINSSLVRRRLKSPDLRFETLSVGRRSQTAVTVCYLHGTSDENVVKKIKEKLSKIDVDVLPDSSYLATLLSERPYSLAKQIGTTEKPDIFCAKIAEGRVGILVDGTPIALTAPYLLIEDFQSSEDYFVPAYRASFTRLLRLFALIVAIYLPAFYIAAQVFKLQFFPVKLLFSIMGSIQNIPFTPALEMLLVLLTLEVLNEASIRMPKYVGMALSVVGALVLGETAVNAGFVSTPAIIIIAFSGIGLYAVPNLIQTTSVIRLAMLLAGGSVGTYGIILLTAFILFYLASCENFGCPLLAPFSPFVKRDMKDSLVKFNVRSLPNRPKTLKSKNKRRIRLD